MKALPTHTQSCLLTRFLSECQLAEALTATTPSSKINHSNRQIADEFNAQENQKKNENQIIVLELAKKDGSLKAEESGPIQTEQVPHVDVSLIPLLLQRKLFNN